MVDSVDCDRKREREKYTLIRKMNKKKRNQGRGREGNKLNKGIHRKKGSKRGLSVKR